MNAKALTVLTFAGLLAVLGNAHAGGTDDDHRYSRDSSATPSGAEAGVPSDNDEPHRGERSGMSGDEEERSSPAGAAIDSNTGHRRGYGNPAHAAEQRRRPDQISADRINKGALRGPFFHLSSGSR